MSAQFKVKIKLHISLFLTKYQPRVLQVSISTINNQAKFSFHKINSFDF